MTVLKKIIKSVLCIVVTLCLIVGATQYVGTLLDPKWSSSAINAIKAFHTMDEDSIDVIIYGSSHAWKGCDPMIMYRDYGLAAYNYGCNWQAINTTLLFLQDSLRTQKPKVACIDTFHVAFVEEDTDMDGQIYYTRAISTFDGKKEYLKQCFGDDIERYVSYYVPIVMFHDNWNAIEAENFFELPTIEHYVSTMGYEVGGTGAVEVVLDDSLSSEQEEIPENSIAILDKMLEVCEENGVSVIFYTAPYEGEYAYSEAMQSYADAHGCTYLNLFDYIDEIGINTQTDFRDYAHLNDSGAAKVADFLGEYITSHCDVRDMRMEEGNIWEQNLIDD